MRDPKVSRRSWALVGLAACGVMVTGCASSGGDPGELLAKSSYLKSACPTPGTKPTGAGAFTYWSSWNKTEPQALVLQHAITCFEKKTGAKVTVQWLGRSLGQQLPAALKSGKAPDLIDADTVQIAPLVQAGALQDISPVLAMKVGEGSKTVKDVLEQSSWKTPQNQTKDGKPFMLPYEVTANAWWYNAKQVTGFSAPHTMDELYSLFAASKKAGRAAVAQDGDVQLYNAYYFPALAEQFAGAGGVAAAAADKTGQSWVSNPGFLQAATDTQKISSSFIDGWDAAKYPQVQDRWADGQADYDFNGSWFPSETRAYLSTSGSSAGLSYGSFQMPKASGATHQVIEQSPIGLGILAGAHNVQAAQAFIAYVENVSILKGIPAVADNLSPRSDISVPADLTDLQKALNDSGTEHTVQYDGILSVAGGNYATNVFYPLNDQLLKGKVTPQEFIKELAATSASFWAAQK